MWSVIDWRFQQQEAQGLVLSKGGLRVKRLTNHKESQEADQRVEILRVSDLGSFVASALTHRQKETPALAGDAHQGLERLALVFVQLASLALSQGWIGRAKVAHQAVLIVRRKASITTPLHAGVQGAIERLSRSDRHVTLPIGSTDIGIVFPLRDQKTQILLGIRHKCRGFLPSGPLDPSPHYRCPTHLFLTGQCQELACFQINAALCSGRAPISSRNF